MIIIIAKPRLTQINESEECMSKDFGKREKDDSSSSRKVIPENRQRPRNLNVSLYSSTGARERLLATTDTKQIPTHTIGNHALTTNQIVDKVSTKSHHKAMKSVASFIDTSRNVNDFENGTKVMLLIRQQLVQSRSDGGRADTLKANVPIFTVVGSSKSDMADLWETYFECFKKQDEKTRKFKVAPFIADPTNSKGKGTKIYPKIETAIGKAYEIRSHAKKTHQQFEDVLNDIHNWAGVRRE